MEIRNSVRDESLLVIGVIWDYLSVPRSEGILSGGGLVEGQLNDVDREIPTFEE